MLQPMGSQRIGHDLLTEQQQQRNRLQNCSYKGLGVGHGEILEKGTEFQL